MAEKKNSKEPVFLVKPASRLGGLDYLHIALLALVIVLVALAFSLAYFKQATVIKGCAYGVVNGTCYTPAYNSSQALSAAERILANYAYVNSSLSLLPYYSEPNEANVSYVQGQDSWLVTVPYIDPLVNDTTFYISMSLSGSSLALQHAFLQTVAPSVSGNNSVVALGTVQIAGKVSCQTSTPFPVYLITDPYAPGAFSAIAKAVNLSSDYPGKLNVSYDFVFTNYASNFYAGYGTYQTQLLGKYLYCSSTQHMVGSYVANLSKIFTGVPPDNETLYQTAVGSGLNPYTLNGCLANSTTSLVYQEQLAKLYDIVSTPQFVVNCRYSSIPETVGYAVNYTIDQMNG